MSLTIKQNIKKDLNIYKPTNIVELIKRSRIDKKKEKRRTVFLAIAAASVLTASGFIISL